MPGPASFAGRYQQYGNSGGYNPFSGSLAAPPAPNAPSTNPLYEFYQRSTNGLDMRPEYQDWLKGQSDPARQQWARERYGVDLGSMLNQYGSADLGFGTGPGGTPTGQLGGANLASLYAGRKWPMAGYGQGLEMNPYQGGGYGGNPGGMTTTPPGGGGAATGAWQPGVGGWENGRWYDGNHQGGYTSMGQTIAPPGSGGAQQWIGGGPGGGAISMGGINQGGGGKGGGKGGGGRMPSPSTFASTSPSTIASTSSVG